MLHMRACTLHMYTCTLHMNTLCPPPHSCTCMLHTPHALPHLHAAHDLHQRPQRQAAHAGGSVRQQRGQVGHDALQAKGTGGWVWHRAARQGTVHCRQGTADGQEAGGHGTQHSSGCGKAQPMGKRQVARHTAFIGLARWGTSHCGQKAQVDAAHSMRA